MNENDELKILIQAALDFEQSLTAMTAQMNQMRERFKDYQIKITAGLDKTASAAQIRTDLRQLNTAKNRVRLVGQMDREATTKNVDSALKKLKKTEVQLTGMLDTASTRKNIQQQLQQIPKVQTEADVNVDGAEQVAQLSQNMGEASRSASGLAANVYLARTALQALRRAAQEAKETVVELDMIKQQINDQVDTLDRMKTVYSKIIDQKKKALEADREAAKRQKTMAAKMEEIAELQAYIDILSLDDSREAQAEKASLMEKLSELQEDLADTQADYAQDAQEKALDEMEDAYHKEKDNEIEILKDSISSYQKLYDLAISYIESNWDTLYQELSAWNMQYGDSLESEIKTAWDNCFAAAEKYGSYVSALGGVTAGIESASGGNNTIVGDNTGYDHNYSNEEGIHAIIKEMYSNAQSWKSVSSTERSRLAARNQELGNSLHQYGVNAIRGDDGVWYVGRVGGEKLFEKYRKYIYHDGGIVGGGDIKSNEQIALLREKEWVLSHEMVGNLIRQMDNIQMFSEAAAKMPSQMSSALMQNQLAMAAAGTVNHVTNQNNHPVEIKIGDTIIHGADQSTVKQHIKVTEDMVNQIIRIIGIRR